MSTTATRPHPARAAARKANGRASVHRRRMRRWTGMLYLLPALLVYTGVVLIPTAQSVQISFYHWNGVSLARWAGLDNYRTFLHDPDLRAAVQHTGVLLLFYAVLPILLGLASAALLSRRRVRGIGFFRGVLFLPQVLTSVVIVVVWRRILAPDGPLNQALRAIGLERLAQNWLGSFTWALPALGVVGAWTTFGLCMVLFIAGAQSIPGELYDAARVDGAGAWREFTTVTLPGLRGQIAVALTLTAVGALRAFDLIWLTTRGGPGKTTTTPSIELYTRAFISGDVGAAAAVGVVLAVVCLGLSLVILRIAEER